MMSKFNVRQARFWALAAGLAVSLSPVVSGADPAPDQMRAPREATTPASNRPQPMGSKDVITTRGALLIPGDWAIGKDVQSQSGDKLGDVSELLIGNRSGYVEYIVVSRGGVAGIGDTKIAVPYEAFGWNDEKRVLTLPMVEADLENAPKFEPGHWDALMDTSKRAELRQYYRVTKTHPEVDVDRVSGGSNGSFNQWPLIECSDIKGQSLKSDKGEDLGTIKEVIYDAMSGRVAFLGVSYGGVLGVGDKLVAVPWNAFQVNNEGKLYAVNLTPERLKAAPRFEKDEWKDLRDLGYNTRVYKYYGYDATWLDRPGTTTTRDSNTQYREYDRLYTSGQAMQGDGLVMLVEQTQATDVVPQLTSVAVHTDDNKDVVIHVAPESYLRENSITLKPGDRIQFKGKWAEIDGKRYLLASEITPPGGKVFVVRGPDGVTIWSRR